MTCFVNKIMTHSRIASDIKTLIPEPALRRRMSKVIKTAVSTAVECVGGIDNIALYDAIITATGWGCLADSEKFLRNIIQDREELLNPTPFIQSTFNTVGGQIALLKHNHCYNVTYVNREHSFEDALLDAMFRLDDGESKNILLGAFDEQTPAQTKIMERMGIFKHTPCGEGAVFIALSSQPGDTAQAYLSHIDFPQEPMTAHECLAKYKSCDDAEILYQSYKEYGLFPTTTAFTFDKGVELIANGAKEVVIYNQIWGGTPTVMVLKCIG